MKSRFILSQIKFACCLGVALAFPLLAWAQPAPEKKPSPPAQTVVKPKRFTITGAVQSPGQYDVPTSMTLLEAVGLARGTQDGARTKVIEVRRVSRNGRVQTTRYNLNNSQDARTLIRAGDTIFVPLGPKSKPPQKIWREAR